MTLTLKQTDLYRFERMVSKLVKPSDAASVKVCLITSGNGNIKLAAFCPDAILTMDVSLKRDLSIPFRQLWMP